MITDTKDGQTNYCPNCEDQARRIEELQSECNEQARLNGMGSEREARLLSRIEELQAESNRLHIVAVVARQDLLHETKKYDEHVEQLERRERMLVDILKRASASLGAFCSDEGWTQEDMNTMDSVDWAISTTPSHSAAWEWNQHVEWCKENLIPTLYMQSTHLSQLAHKACGSDSMFARCSYRQLHSDYEPLFAIPELKEVT